MAELPYAGTSGWSGSEQSRQRAYGYDTSGVTENRQSITLRTIQASGYSGLTWKELGDLKGWHHGTASSVLSVLHKSGKLARLVESRGRCSIYVMPEFVQGREVSEHGRTKEFSKDKFLERLDKELDDIKAGAWWDGSDVLTTTDVRELVERVLESFNVVKA